MTSTATLDRLAVGQRALVIAVQGVDETAVRLLEMGLTPGVELQLRGQAPLGDPLEFELRGYRLSLRKSEARLVQIAPIS